MPAPLRSPHRPEGGPPPAAAPRRRAGRAPGVPLYVRIAGDLRRRIAGGALRPGERLPSVRDEARRLRVNRMTVAHAYRELAREGLVRGTVGSGTVVAAGSAHPRPPGGGAPAPMLWDGLAGSQAGAVAETLRLVEGLEAEAEPGRITFERAVPDTTLLRAGALRDATLAALRHGGRDLLGAGPAEGHPDLRRAVAALLAARGVRCRSEEVLIVSGVQQGLDLILRTFCNPGEAVVLDDPSYYRSLLLFRYHRLHLLGLPVEGGEDGADRAALLEALMAERPARLLYTVSTFHNPTGRTQGREERLGLLEAARRRPLPVVEDDSLWELRYEGNPAPPLPALDAGGRVLYLGSFSKILAPGLRLGWVVAPEEALRELARVKEICDLRGNLLIQAAVARLVLDGHLERHLRRARRVYRERRDAMAASLERRFPPEAAWEIPQGGLTFWVTLPAGCDSRRLLDRALARGVSFCPGTLFRVRSGGENQMRLAFGHLEPRDIERGLRTLGALARDEIARAGSARPAARARARPADAPGPLF